MNITLTNITGSTLQHVRVATPLSTEERNAFSAKAEPMDVSINRIQHMMDGLDWNIRPVHAPLTQPEIQLKPALANPVHRYSAQSMIAILSNRRPKRKRYAQSWESYQSQLEVDNQLTITIDNQSTLASDLSYGKVNEPYPSTSYYNSMMDEVTPASTIDVTINSLGASVGYSTGYNAKTFGKHPATPKLLNLIMQGNSVTIHAYEFSIKLPRPYYKDVAAARDKQLKYLCQESMAIKNKIMEEYFRASFPKTETESHLDVFNQYLSSGQYQAYQDSTNAYLNAKIILQNALLDIMQMEEERALIEDMSYQMAALDEVVFEGEYPRQDTTPPVVIAADVHFKFSNFEDPSATKVSTPWVTTDSEMFTTAPVGGLIQAKLDAYYYSVEEFRKPDRDAMEAELEQLTLEYEDLKKYVVIFTDPERYFNEKKGYKLAYERAINKDNADVDKSFRIYQKQLELQRYRLAKQMADPIAQYLLELQERIYTLSLEVKVTSHGNIADVVSCTAVGYAVVDNK